jgi:hypothetical protein
MLIVDVSKVKLPSEVKQNNLPPKCGQPIDGVKIKRLFFIDPLHIDLDLSRMSS